MSRGHYILVAPAGPNFKFFDGLLKSQELDQHLRNFGPCYGVTRTKCPIAVTTDHTITKSVYFLDPDGNQLEIFAEGFDEPSEALDFIRQGTYRVKPLELEVPSAG